mmetsp:Transcript_2922/g.6763  ORF Transcript_2922/g.6763 Transcript_2922/m.6763 type:complete len:159 (+) Transcript_2922:473-949(+)
MPPKTKSKCSGDGSCKRGRCNDCGRAILVKGLDRLNAEDESFSMGGYAKQKGRDEFSRLEEGEGLEQNRYSRAKVDDNVVQKAVDYVTSKKNIAPLSWGSKSTKLDANETVELPCLTRLEGRDQIWKGYCLHTNDDETRIGRTLFYNMTQQSRRVGRE